MITSPQVSVIIRVRDEAANLERSLRLLAGQRCGGRTVEVVVVDGGSSDGTMDAARAHGARIVEIPRSAFTFGRALNLGCANARGELLVALSAHAFAHDADWLARLLEPFSDPRVACACGDRYGPLGEELTARVEQSLALAREWPDWGYSNAAGAFRAELWRRHPFRSDLPGCEDKEWAMHWLARGRVCVIEPSFSVDHDHTHDSVRAIYRRARTEWAGFATFLELPPYTASELAHDWWSDQRWYGSTLRARFSHRRAARMLGTYAGRRRGSPGVVRGADAARGAAEPGTPGKDPRAWQEP